MIDLFTTPKGNANVLNSLLKSLKVKVTSSFVYSCLHEHPGYPSLLSFSDCLKEWRIPNVAYHINKEEYNAADLSFPLLAHIGGERHKFILIENIQDGNVIFNHDYVSAKISRYLVSFGLMKKDTGSIRTALNDWYKLPTKDYENWAKDYPFESIDGFDEVTKMQKEWCDKTKVSFTPTILINGHRLPDPYRLEDLKYFLN